MEFSSPKKNPLDKSLNSLGVFDKMKYLMIMQYLLPIQAWKMKNLNDPFERKISKFPDGCLKLY